MSSRARQVSTTVPFLWGNFKTFSLADIFGVLSISRQHVRVRFSDGEKEVGAIAVKSGQVIGAEDFRNRTRGADALKGLISDPGTAFSVDRLPRGVPGTRTAATIGKLAELLPEAGRGRRSVEAPTMTKPATAESHDPLSLGDILGAPEMQVPVPTEKADGPLREFGNEGDGAPPRPSPPSDQSSPDGEVVLRGNVSDVGFDEILEVLQLDPQHLLISFIRGGSQIGTVNLMSEQVLGASAGSLRGVDAFKQLFADHGETFEVRRSAALDASEALGEVSELLAEMQQARVAPPTVHSGVSQGERSLFMQGRLANFPLELLIGSLDLCRQPIELVLRREEEILHRVLVKSGRITAVVSAFGEGVDGALAAIREDPGAGFLVYRCKGLAERPPVAMLEALVSAGDAVPDSTREQFTPSAGHVGAPVASVPKESGTDGDQPFSIEARLEQVADDLTASHVPQTLPGQDPARDDPEQAQSPSAADEAELPRGQHDALEKTMQELRSVLAALRTRRRERVLLWCILAFQLGILVVAFALLVRATPVPLTSINIPGPDLATDSSEIARGHERTDAGRNVDSE